MAEIQVTINEAALLVAEAVAKEPRRHDLELVDLVATQDRIIEPRTVAIFNGSPVRGRGSGVNVTLVGVGFNPEPTRNRVQMVGFACTVVSATETQLVFQTNFFASFVTGTHITVTVENLAVPGSYAEWLWWSLDDIDTIADAPLETQIAGPSELPELERPEYAEAQDWEKMAALVDHLCGHAPGMEAGDLLLGTGDGFGPLQSRNADLEWSTVEGWQWGQVLVAEPAGARVGLMVDHDLTFGGTVPAGTSEAELVAGGSQDEAVGGGNILQAAATAGILDLVHLFCYRPAGTDTLDRVEILVNGAVQFDSGAGLGIGHQQTYAQEIGVAVEREDEIALRVYKLGATVPIEVVGGIRMELD